MFKESISWKKEDTNMKKNTKNKGFTLVELIVVLVILAILAAILVPALLGYIDAARNKQTVLDAKSCLTAAQAEMSNIYASKSGVPGDIAKAPHDKQVRNMADMASLKTDTFQVGCTTYKTGDDKKTQHDAFTITWAYYKNAAGKELWFDGESWLETEYKIPSTKTSYTIPTTDSTTP